MITLGFHTSKHKWGGMSVTSFWAGYLPPNLLYSFRSLDPAESVFSSDDCLGVPLLRVGP